MVFSYPDKIDVILIDSFCDGVNGLDTAEKRESYARPLITGALLDLVGDMAKSFRMKAARKNAQAAVKSAEEAAQSEVDTEIKKMKQKILN